MNLTPELQQVMYEALKAVCAKMCSSCAAGRPFEGGAHTFSGQVRSSCSALYERTLLARIDQELADVRYLESKGWKCDALMLTSWTKPPFLRYSRQDALELQREEDKQEVANG